MQLCVCVFIPPEVKLLVQLSEHNHGTSFQVACVGDAGTNWLAMWVFCCGWITSSQGYRLNAWALIKECKTILYVHGNNRFVFAISLPGIELIKFKVSTTTLVAAIRMNMRGVARFACGWKVHTTCMIRIKKTWA